MLKLRYLLWLGLFLSSSAGWSARLASYCTLEEGGSEVQGKNFEERMPLASVSKLFTTFLAVNNNQIDRKIYTQFYFTPVSKDTYDVHIRGAHEPYFGRQNLHLLISKLNEAGVLQIRRLSFDENFKYYHDTDKIIRLSRKKRLDPKSGKMDLDAPSPEEVRMQLTQNKEIHRSYQQSVKEAAENGIRLQSHIFFNPKEITFLPSNQFTETAQTQKGYVASAELLHILKLMNWTSNNHAANQVFQISGGVKAFNALFYQKLGLSERDVLFVNGSGQNANLTGDGREYNEATCTTVVKTVRALKKALESQKAQLQDALAVVGGDVGSTVGGATYTTPLTKMSVIAKTGTVGTNVTLAGMISAQSGNHFFFYNVEVNSAPRKARNKNAFMRREAARARKIISIELNKLIKKLGGPKPIAYQTKFFDLKNFEDADENDDTNNDANVEEVLGD